MQNIEINQIDSDSKNYLFQVRIKDYEYKVTLNDDYYQKLSNGQQTPAELVEKSFQFLLSKENPTSILSEFDLSVIQRYFSDFEEKITAN